MAETSARHVVVGTAGHIDHGKSTLVRALTGVDPDRLPEERRRGITIDLGFAHAAWDGVEFSFVDVPGHEKFVHNMLAGASGIDLLLLVVAADESVMPQTREHLGICRLLGLETGVVALTRIDLAGPELTELAAEEVRELVRGTFLEDAPLVEVSGATGEGLDALRAALRSAAERAPREAAGPWPRLPIDRVFAAKGFGTVVTGTLHGGALRVGDPLVASPGGPEARVRGLQVHGASVECAPPRRRVAVNLQGADRARLERGMTLVPPGRDVAALVFDAALTVLRDAPAPLEEGMRVRVHLGTAEVMARLRLPPPGRLAPGESGAGQLRLETPLAALPGDRFVLRRFSPVATLAGGVVADLDPPRRSPKDAAWGERAAALAAMTGAERLAVAAAEAGERGLPLAERAPRLGLEPAAAKEIAAGLAKGGRGARFHLAAGERLLSADAFAALEKGLRAELSRRHRERPLESGVAPELLRAVLAPRWPQGEFRALLEAFAAGGGIVVEADAVRLASHRVDLEGEEKLRYDRLLAALEAAGLEALPEDEWLSRAGLGPERKGLAGFALRRREAIRLGDGAYVSAAAFRALAERLRAEAEGGRTTFGVPEFKELFGLTRKYAIPLLEKLDDVGVTQRVGNERRVRQAWTNERGRQ